MTVAAIEEKEGAVHRMMGDDTSVVSTSALLLCMGSVASLCESLEERGIAREAVKIIRRQAAAMLDDGRQVVTQEPGEAGEAMAKILRAKGFIVLPPRTGPAFHPA